MSISLDSRLLASVVRRLLAGGPAVSRGLQVDGQVAAQMAMRKKMGLFKKGPKDLPIPSGGLSEKEIVSRKSPKPLPFDPNRKPPRLPPDPKPPITHQESPSYRKMMEDMSSLGRADAQTKGQTPAPRDPLQVAANKRKLELRKQLGLPLGRAKPYKGPPSIEAKRTTIPPSKLSKAEKDAIQTRLTKEGRAQKIATGPFTVTSPPPKEFELADDYVTPGDREIALFNQKVKGINKRKLGPSELAKELAQRGKRKEEWKAKPVLSRQAERDAEDAIERGFDEGYDSSVENRLSALKSAEVDLKIQQYRQEKGGDPPQDLQKRWRAEWHEKAKEDGRLGFRVLTPGQEGMPKLKEKYGGVKYLNKQYEDVKKEAYKAPKGPAREKLWKQEVPAAGKALGEEAQGFKVIINSILKNSSNPGMELNRFLRKFPEAAKALDSRARFAINEARQMGKPLGEAGAALAKVAGETPSPEKGYGPKFAARVALGDSLNIKNAKDLTPEKRAEIAWRIREKAARITEGEPTPQNPRTGMVGPTTSEQEFVEGISRREKQRSHQTTGMLSHDMMPDVVVGGGKDARTVSGAFFTRTPNPKPLVVKSKELPYVSEMGKAAFEAGKPQRPSKNFDVSRMVGRLNKAAEKFRDTDPTQAAQLERMAALLVKKRLGDSQRLDPKLYKVLQAMGYEV